MVDSVEPKRWQHFVQKAQPTAILKIVQDIKPEILRAFVHEQIPSLNRLEFRRLQMKFTPLHHIFCDDIFQYILSFVLDDPAISMVTSKWTTVTKIVRLRALQIAYNAIRADSTDSFVVVNQHGPAFNLSGVRTMETLQEVMDEFLKADENVPITLLLMPGTHRINRGFALHVEIRIMPILEVNSYLHFFMPK